MNPNTVKTKTKTKNLKNYEKRKSIKRPTNKT